MRLCEKCRVAVENRAVVCPQCGAALAAGPKVNPSGPAPGRHPVAQAVFDLADLVPIGGPVAAAFLVVVLLPFFLLTRPLVALRLILPLVAGGIIGHLIYGYEGALCGVIGGAVLFLAVVSWREHRRGR